MLIVMVKGSDTQISNPSQPEKFSLQAAKIKRKKY